MALTVGTMLGPYEILDAIGAGGMGEVYRARDTKLNRDVALKVLPDSVASDPDRLARFTREAQTLASLNHPNIAHIHGLEESSGVRALVMELVEGEDLSQRIARGAIPIDEALPIAKQIADALEAAHEQGIIHRDLKPANIKVRSDGTVKVLDFGLAKAMDPAVGSSSSVSMSPTITTPAMTQAGMILGTAAYMSPEQAKGRAADKRADIWAFGCVLFEMLTGARAFEGEDVSDTLASVLKGSPPWNALPRTVPAPLRTLLTLCLEKDRSRRMTDIAVAQFLLSDKGAGPSAATENLATERPVWPRVLAWGVAAVLAVSLALVITRWASGRRVSSVTPLRLTADLGADASLAFGPFSAAAILSPDGTILAFVAQHSTTASPQLFVRRLDQLQASAVGGTDGAFSPFFSPDGQWIAFFTTGKLKKVAVTGGAVVTLCDVPSGRGGTWGEDGTIVFSPNSAQGANLMRVSSSGGKPEALTTLAPGEATERWPQLLPGGKGVLYMSSSHTGGLYDDANVVVQPLPTGTPKIVQRGGYFPRYSPSGHLLYVYEGTLFAAPFDLDRLEVTGPPAPALEGMASGQAGGAQFALSGNGTMVYAPGQTSTSDPLIFWMDREGKTTTLRATPAGWSHLQFSPDGRRLAMSIRGGSQSSDVWVYEWARDTLTRLTFDARGAETPAWTPDGNRIAFASRRDNATFNLYWQRADGTGEAQRLTNSKNSQYLGSWHPSGKFLAFVEFAPQTSGDLMILPMEGDEASGWKPGTPTVFLNSPAAETQPVFSPDGRWLAYDSNESGRQEVYVRPFPGPGGKWQISTDGGANPTWSRARHELFFSAGDRQFMVAPYATEGNSFRAEKPRLYSPVRFLARPGTVVRPFDLHPDGLRFAFAPAVELTGMKQDKIVFVFNFFEELKRIAPLKR